MSKSKADRRQTSTRTESANHNESQGALISPAVQILLIFLLFATAFGVRMYRITEPPLDFNVPRQYRSAINARAYYYSMIQGVPEWKTRNAQLAHEQQGILEPPGMAMVTAVAYESNQFHKRRKQHRLELRRR